jgi:hypothetical protein
LTYAEVYLRGEARAQVPDRLAPCSRVAVNVAVKCERKVSRKLGDPGVSINLVYLATNTRLVFGADGLAVAKACGVVRVGSRGG